MVGGQALAWTDIPVCARDHALLKTPRSTRAGPFSPSPSTMDGHPQDSFSRAVSSPVPTRHPPPAPRTLSPRAAATRIPPSLQAKMAAVRTRSARQFPPSLIIPLSQMANRANNANSAASSPGPSSHPNGIHVDSTTAALARTGLGEHHPGLLRSFQSAPSRPNALSSRPGMLGMAAKRKRPGLHLADILEPDANMSGGGASAAGLGAGRPNGFEDDAPPARRMAAHLTASPFANFDKIV